MVLVDVSCTPLFGHALRLSQTKVRLLLTGLVAFSAIFFARSEEESYYFAVNDESISKAGNWKDANGVVQTKFSSTGDYYIEDVVQARITAETFQGKSLVIGAADKPVRLLNKLYSKRSRFNNLVFKNGSFLTVSASGSDRTAHVAGTITVASPAENAFTLCRASDSSGLSFDLEANIAGDEGTGLKFVGSQRNDECSLRLAGDNDDFHGQLILTGDRDYASGVDDWWVTVASSTALGGSCASPTENAVDISLQGTARLVFTPEAGPLISAENRGISVGCRDRQPASANISDEALILEAQDGADVELALPIASSVLLRKCGPGRLTISGECALSEGIACVEGILVLASQTAIESASVIGGNCWVRSPDTVPYTVSGRTFDGASIIVLKNETVGTCVLDATCEMTAAKTKLILSVTGGFSDDEEICLMKIPSCVREVSVADFEVDLSSLPYGLPRYDVAVKDLGGGLQGVCLVRRYPVVFRSDNNGDATFSTGGTTWSDGQSIHPGADYVIVSKEGEVFLGIRTVKNVSFAGESLTLTDGAQLLLKANSQDLKEVFILPGGSISAMRADGGPQLVYGTIHIEGTAENPSVIAGRSDGCADIRGPLVGSGVVLLRGPTGWTNPALEALRASSPNFSGRIVVAQNDKAKANSVYFGKCDDVFGGSLDSFDYAALTVENGCTLVPDETTTLNTLNRGILLRGDVAFDVAQGVDLTIDQALTYNGRLMKKGSGSIILKGRTWFENATQDGVTDVPMADKNLLVLEEGEVAVGASKALAGIKLVAGAGGVRFPADGDGPLGAELSDVDVSSASLNVFISTERCFKDVPLFTVSATTAASLANKFTVIDPAHPRHKVSAYFVDSNDDSGRKTLTVSYSKAGLVMVVQ